MASEGRIPCKKGREREIFDGGGVERLTRRTSLKTGLDKCLNV